ncbi:MAG: HD domain-containing phosphohydrolase [Cyanobacteria bacterium P01_E01_bin.34]
MRPESTLNRLKASFLSDRLPSSFGVYFKNTLVALCHALEDHILQTSDAKDNAAPLVLVTFQQGKWYLQEADRYLDIAQKSSHVVVAAVSESGFHSHETGGLDNVSLVDLDPSDSWVEEWNLIILAPNYSAMVLCHELEQTEYWEGMQPERDVERKFYGLWTFDPDLVREAAAIAVSRIEPYKPELAAQLKTQIADIGICTDCPPADLSGVVSRIVTYLQSSQEQLVATHRQNRELWDLEGQAKRLNRNITANKLQALLRMAQRVDKRDPFNSVASLQVSALSETIGQILDIPTIDLRRLRLAGLLFRIGLSEAPAEVFTLPASELDERSPIFWRDRGSIGAQLLSSMPELKPVIAIVKYQLEYWNGGGLPDSLKGTDIPLGSRILGVVAFFQDLTQPRGDRPAMSLNEALAECETLSGSRFDPELVTALTTVVRLAEVGMLQLPQQPSKIPQVWLEEAIEEPMEESLSKSEVA